MTLLERTLRDSGSARRGAGLRARRGYSFPEVMFAVVVLGIGFIMLAAVFPVAIKQSKLTSDETRGAALGREAAGIVQTLARGTDGTTLDWRRTSPPTVLGHPPAVPDPNYGGPRIMPLPPAGNLTNPAQYGDGLPLHIGRSLFPPTGSNYSNKRAGEAPVQGVVRPVWTLFGWDLLRGNMVVPHDPRYAWTVLYRRDGDCNDDPKTWSPLVQLFIIVANARTHDFYDFRSDGPDVAYDWKPIRIGTKPFPANVDDAPSSTANLYPRFVQVVMKNDYKNTSGTGAGPDKLSAVVPAPANSQSQPSALVEGAYVITEGTANGINGALKNEPGRVYRLGAQIPSTTGEVEFELVPGNDMASQAEDTKGSFEWVMVLGREWDPQLNGGSGGFKGPAQDIYLYTTVISIVQK